MINPDDFLADAYATLPVSEKPWVCMLCDARFPDLAAIQGHRCDGMLGQYLEDATAVVDIRPVTHPIPPRQTGAIPMSAFYANQAHNTSAVYIDGVFVETVGDDYVSEKVAIANYIKTHRFVERVVFGHGRTALVFVSRPATRGEA